MIAAGPGGPATAADGLNLGQLASEVSAIQSRVATLQAELEAERAAHAKTRKELAAGKAREKKLQATIDQRGPIDSLQEHWLQRKRARARWDLSSGKAGVRLELPGRGPVITKSLAEAVDSAMKRWGE